MKGITFYLLAHGINKHILRKTRAGVNRWDMNRRDSPLDSLLQSLTSYLCIRL